MLKLSLTRLITFNIQKRFFTTKPLNKSTPTTNNTTSENSTTSSSSFTIDYLTKSCGLPLKSAIWASKKVTLVKRKKPQYDSVVEFLKSNEFSDTQVVKLMQKHSGVLVFRISTNLEPKFKFFTENGISSTVLPEIFMSNPSIFFRSVDKQLRPVMQLLRSYITSDDKLEAAILRGSEIFNCDVKTMCIPNVEFLIQQRVPKNRIGDILVAYPRCLFYTSLGEFACAIDRTRVMAVNPSDNNFIHALHAVHALRAVLAFNYKFSWEENAEIFKSIGWSIDEDVSMFLRFPSYSSYTDMKFRHTMDFLVNTVKTEPETVIGDPYVFTYSLEKQIIPRYTIWKILTERDLIQKTPFLQLISTHISDEFFTESYIKRFSTEIPDLQSIYDQSKKLGRVWRK